MKTHSHDWSVSHYLKFKVDKFALAHLSKKCAPGVDRGKSTPLPRPALVLRDVTIQPSKSVRLLGVNIDEGLHWQVQVNVAVAKGMSYMLAARGW